MLPVVSFNVIIGLVWGMICLRKLFPVRKESYFEIGVLFNMYFLYLYKRFNLSLCISLKNYSIYQTICFLYAILIEALQAFTAVRLNTG